MQGETVWLGLSPTVFRFPFRGVRGAHSPFRGVEHDGPGLVQVRPEERPPRPSVQAGHVDAVAVRVRPVDVVVQPVQRDAVRRHGLGQNDGTRPGLPQQGPGKRR